MRISTITVSASRTINTGNYNSMKVEGACTIELEPGEDESPFIDIARRRAIAEIKLQMEECYKEVKPK